MANNLKDFIVTLSIIGLFAFAIISFGINLQTENNVNNTILDNPIINRTFNNLNSTLDDFRDEAQTQKESYESEIPERGFGALVIYAIVGVIQKFTSLVVGIYNVLIVLPASVLGIPPVVIGLISAILIITLLLLGWRTIISGN